MTLTDYQKAAKTTLIHTDKEVDNKDYLLFRMVLGLLGETGEVAEKIKKQLRTGIDYNDEKFKEDLKKELGDVLWYMSMLAEVYGFDLESVAQTNIEKLSARKASGTIFGSGDNR